jgi:thiol-disulfide isomerase/thioredoxin
MQVSLAGPVFALVAAVAFVALLAGCGSRQAPSAGHTPTAEELKQAEFLKSQKLDGQVAFIEFGIVGCPLSEKGLDEMTRLESDKAIPNLAFLRVDETRDPAAADKYFAERKPGFAVVRDADNALARAFDATAIPTFVLVDKFGRIRYKGKFPETSKLGLWARALLEQKNDLGAEVTPFGVAELDTPKLLEATRLPDLAGSVTSLKSLMGRNGLLLVFVDTTCPFSGTAIGEMPQVAAALVAQQIPSVLVNLDDAKEDVLPSYAKRATGTPVLYDVTTATKENWKIDMVPTVIYLDAKGAVVYRGKAVWKDLAGSVEKALSLAPGTVKIGAEGIGFG